MYEKYGDFYFPAENIIIELKSLQETEISKTLRKIKHPFTGTVPFNDSFSPISNHLTNANMKATRAKNNEKYKNATFVTLLSIINGYDLNVLLFFGNLQGTKFLNYPLIAYNGEFVNEETKKYFIREKADDNDLLQATDYIGVLRKYGDFTQWKIELIEKPHYTKEGMPQNSQLVKFIEVWRAKFL